ncbi:hypothetical protein HYFRA_00012811 [Hymenoscyphus fraxineus]|uniref:Uncharacterized protein n=1 Tax=Hymenoscyphus fraxineus TaxID=746836 RepID=A0A9N9PUI3_9HELO|nr:hypothetical protein HYFRA_00012811 [Hymenoscyphus fraxineus]
MATQWLSTKQKLEATGKSLALSLIGLLVFFSRDNIPESVFVLTGEGDGGGHIEIPDRFPALKELAKQDKLLEASSSLLSQSLISKVDEKKIFSINPSMYTIVFEAMTPSEKQESYENAAYLLYRNFPGKAKDGEDMKMRWNLCNTYFPHVLKHLERAEEGKVVKSEYSAQMIMNTVRYAWEIGDFGQVKSLLTKCHQACQEIKTVDTGLTEAEALHFAAWLNAKMGKLAPAKTPSEAVIMTKQALDLRLKRLPKDDPIIGGAYGNLAMFTIATAEYEDSLKYSQDCLDIRMLNEKNETTNISVTHNYFGWCYAKMGDNEKSRWDSWKVSGNFEDADACYKTAQEYYSKAEKSFKEGINVLEKNFGARARKGPQIIWPMYALRNLCLSLGREDEAYQLHTDAHNLGISLYGSTSPRVFIWQFKDAWHDYHKGKYALARQKSEALLNEMNRQSFYIGHVARTQYFLSRILEAQGDSVASQRFLDDAIKNAETLNGEGWRPTRGEQDFDDLVFFHDR